MESTGQSSDAATGQCKMPLQSTGVSSAAVSGESSKTSTEESVMAIFQYYYPRIQLSCR